MANHPSRRDQFKFWVLAWVSLAQSVVEIVTFASVIPSWRAKLLFSDWMDYGR